MLKIVQIPNKVLTSPSKHVKKFDTNLLKLIKEMEKTLRAQTDPEGVGLAAPQIGVGENIFIMKAAPDSEIEAFINPKILKVIEGKVKGKKDSLEGCLSIPRIWSPVKRPQKVLLKYQTPDGTEQERWFTDFEAVIVQHEVDHLHGILFTQRAIEQNAQLFEEKDGELKKMGHM